MVKWCVTAVCCAIALMVIVIMQGCSATPAAPNMTQDTKAKFKVNCLLGKIHSVEVLTDGPGRFNLEFEKDECDEDDRT